MLGPGFKWFPVINTTKMFVTQPKGRSLNVLNGALSEQTQCKRAESLTLGTKCLLV